MQFSLKRVLVSGAGSGLGRAVALALAERSIPVVCVDARKDGVGQTVDLIQQAGGAAEAFAVDVADEAGIASVFAHLASGLPLDGLVTCAGIHNKTSILDLTRAEWDHVLAVNLTGTFRFVQEALRMMIPNEHGRIVTIASDTGKRGGGRGGKSAYGASKGAVLAFTRSIARELGQYGGKIRINCVSPGPMLTEMHKDLSVDTKTMVENAIPMGRFGTPAEVASGILYLLSDDASYIYGETLSVDGGVLMD
jgi:NAD(P)-dependent dehydrogenase (short-subunit alcohol dehydrogenase family)